MQQQGTPTFIQAHTGIVKGVAFSPNDRYVFCSGGTDGKVNVYNALQGKQTMSTRITSPHAMKNINAVKFNADGSRILSTTSKRLSVIDAERGELICSYDNCAYSGKDRAPLASDPRNPNLAICGCTNGRGLITFDLRKQQPAHFALNIHSSLIRDIIYLDESWPFGDSNQRTIASVSLDGVCKIRSIDNCELYVVDVKHRSNCVTATPDTYFMLEDGGFESVMMVGGDYLTGFMPESGRYSSSSLDCASINGPINKLKYTSNGCLLYAISSNGSVGKFRRNGYRHDYMGEVYSHNDEIIDMDLSPNDEYLVTASKDGTVGLLCLGAPSYGWTGFMQIA